MLNSRIPFSMDEGSPDVIEHNGRFYINVGRPGFNSKTNNGAGYDSKKIAQEVIEGKRSRSK